MTNKHNKTRKHNTKKHNKTRKHQKHFLRLPNRTPYDINEMSQLIFKNSPTKMPFLADSIISSYSPTVNKELVMLQSIKRDQIHNCNNQKAFELKEPLQIGIPGKIFGKNCSFFGIFIIKEIYYEKNYKTNRIRFNKNC